LEVSYKAATTGGVAGVADEGGLEPESGCAVGRAG
jgi:hypothetical protein